MSHKYRFALISICFLLVVVVPWRTETIIPAEITLTSHSFDAKAFSQHPLKNSVAHTVSFNQERLIHPMAQAVVVKTHNKQHTSYNVLTPQNIELHATTSKHNALELSKGQDAIFFPENEQVNPMYITLTAVSFNSESSQIKGRPLKIMQYLEDNKIKGMLAIKGERKSLFMRFYNSVFQ